MKSVRGPAHVLLLGALGTGAAQLPVVHAQPALAQAAEPPPTFAYTEAAEADYLRALLELSGVIAVGYLWYLTQTDIADDYDVNYSWAVFRRKLSGEAIGFDTNHFGTNFIGHPLGGTGYYLAARSNRLGILTAFGLATGGSLVWEYFGEARERVSLNDMIVTPFAGLAIGEPLLQLGAFFDRSSPALHNRILASVFAPLKSLNDLLDGLTPARTARVDRHGFPADEWHAFELGAGVATTIADRIEPTAPRAVSHEVRIGLASRLVRLPDYDGAGRHSLVFDDANVSSLALRAAFGASGLVDFDFQSSVVLLGHYFREARRLPDGSLWGSDTLIGLVSGYAYSLHDYDRDRPAPIDRVSSVQPLGIALEQGADFGAGRVFTRASASGCFGGISPYALSAYRRQVDLPELPPVIRERQYYFGLGGCVLGLLGVAAGKFEALGTLEYERYAQVGSTLPASDQRTRLAARAGSAIADGPVRFAGFVERRARAGELGRARAERGELSLGVEIGARF